MLTLFNNITSILIINMTSKFFLVGGGELKDNVEF